MLEGQTTPLETNLFRARHNQDDNWYHVVIIYDKSTLKVYVNGVTTPAYSGLQIGAVTL